MEIRNMMRVTVLVLLVLFAGGTLGYEDKTIAQWLSDNGFGTLVSVLKSANLYNVLGDTSELDFAFFMF